MTGFKKMQLTDMVINYQIRETIEDGNRDWTFLELSMGLVIKSRCFLLWEKVLERLTISNSP